MAADAGASGSTRNGVRKRQAGRRSVGQHIIQKRARKPSIDVHRTEEGVKREVIKTNLNSDRSIKPGRSNITNITDSTYLDSRDEVRGKKCQINARQEQNL